MGVAMKRITLSHDDPDVSKLVPVSEFPPKDQSYIYYLETAGRLQVFDVTYPWMSTPRKYIKKDVDLTRKQRKRKPKKPTLQSSNDQTISIALASIAESMRGIIADNAALNAEITSMRKKLDVVCGHVYHLHKWVLAITNDLNIKLEED
jgi:hypothetical protein